MAKKASFKETYHWNKKGDQKHSPCNKLQCKHMLAIGKFISYKIIIYES